MSWRRMFFILWRIQTRRALHRIAAWPHPGGILGAVILLGLTLMGLYLVMASSLDRLLNPDAMREALQAATGLTRDLLRYTRYEDVPDQSARLILTFLQGTWLSALFLKWGHWQSLERDSEWEWFADKPWPPLALFIQRCLVESLWPQVFSLFLATFFIMLGLRRELPPLHAASVGIALTLMLQALLAAPRLTWDLWLKQSWSSARVRTFRGLSAIAGAALLVMSIQVLGLNQSWLLTWLGKHGHQLDRLPAGLALSSLILSDSESALGSALMLFLIVCGTHILCYAVAARLLRKPWLGFQGWFHANLHAPRRGPSFLLLLWKKLHPLTRRDLILLRRDRHFMLQMLVAPWILSLLPQSLPRVPVTWVWAMAFGTGGLFLWSAVFSILPMEGQSLWMIFTWPESIMKFLWRRLQFQLGLTAVYTLLVLMLGFWRLDSHALIFEIWRLPYLILGLLGYAWLLTAFAVWSYAPEAIQGRPRLILQYAALIPAVSFAWLFLQPEPWKSLCGLMALGLTTGCAWWFTRPRLLRILDRPLAPKKNLARAGMRLYFLKLITR
jgi:ABC-2 type transport system permease protein